MNLRYNATPVDVSHRQECYAEILKAVIFLPQVTFFLRKAELDCKMTAKFQVDRVCFQEYRAQKSKEKWNKKKKERKEKRIKYLQ